MRLIMKLTLPSQTRKLIEQRVRSGKYATAEQVVVAAVSQLDQQEQLGDFEPGELDRLLAIGEKSGRPLDGGKVLSEFRKLRDRRRVWTCMRFGGM
jgi:Arc/MetJ-type ribon-helix-helix transcriptional regulator